MQSAQKAVKMVPVAIQGKEGRRLSRKERDELILKYRDNALRVASRILASYRFKMDNEELQSLVDLSLCEAAGRFRPGLGASFITFAFYYIKGNIVRAIDASMRLSKGTRTLEEEAMEAEKEPFFSESPEVQLERDLSRATLIEALAQLGVAQRAIIDEIFFKDLNVTVAAKKMRLSRGHVSRLKSAALKSLLEKLGGSCDF